MPHHCLIHLYVPLIGVGKASVRGHNFKFPHAARVSNVKNESMRINYNGMFLDGDNPGVHRAMNSWTIAPPFFPADSIFRMRLAMAPFLGLDQNILFGTLGLTYITVSGKLRLLGKTVVLQPNYS